MNEALIQRIADSGYEVPEGMDPERQIPRLTELLGSTDQILRERSCEILDAWGERGHFSDEALRALGDQMAETLCRGLGEEGTDSVFLRSYAALVLCLPLAADELFAAGAVEGRGTFLRPEQVARWRVAAIDSLRRERDVRGFVDGKGWADAICHMGDALHQFARSPHTGADGQQEILEAISERLKRPSNEVSVHNEGGRLMRAAVCVMLRGELPPERITSWIASFARTSDGGSWGWNGIFNLEFCDHRAVIARANVAEALHSLYFLLKLGVRRPSTDDPVMKAYQTFYDRPIRGQEGFVDALVATLRQVQSVVYPRA